MSWDSGFSVELFALFQVGVLILVALSAMWLFRVIARMLHSTGYEHGVGPVKDRSYYRDRHEHKHRRQP